VHVASPPKEVSDEQLMASTVQGSMPALEEWYGRSAHRIRRFTCRLWHGYHEAESITHRASGRGTKRFFVLSLLLALWSGEVAVAGDNVVENPGFESGFQAWNVASPNDSERRRLDVVLDQTVAHSGQASAQLALDFDQNAQIYCPVQTVNVFPDMEYLLSAYVQTALSVGDVHLEIQDSRGWQVLLVHSEPLHGQSPWRKVEIRFRTGLSTEALRVGLRHVGRAGDGLPLKGRVWLDDVVLVATEHDRPRLSREDFEHAIRNSRLIALENPAVRIAFSGPRLRLRSVEFKNRPELTLAADPLTEASLYQIRLVGPDGRTQTIRSIDARSVSHKVVDPETKHFHVLEASHNGPIAKVAIHVTLAESGWVDLRLAPGPLESGWAVSEVVFPQMVTQGLLSGDPTKTLVGSDKPIALGTTWRFTGGRYPANPRIPLLYQYGPRGGLYLMVLDPDQWVKLVEMVPYFDNERKLTAIAWRYGVNVAPGDRFPSYTARLGPIEHSPYEAAEVYRDWARQQPWFPAPLSQRTDIGSWRLRGVPHYYIYLPGSGPDMLPKHPRDMTLEEIQEYQRKHQGKFRLTEVPAVMEALPKEVVELGGVVDLRGWEKWGLWMNPDWWPPQQGEPALREAIAAIHKAGLHVTADVMFNELSIHKPKEQGGLGQEGQRALDVLGLVPDDVAMKNERGEIPLLGAPPFTGNPVCPTVRASFDHTVSTLTKMKDTGFDDVQFDGGGYSIGLPCWNRKHAHPPGYGYWQTAAARDYYERLRDAIPGAQESGFGMWEEYYNELRAHSYMATYTRCEQDVAQRVKTLQDKRLAPEVGMFSFVYHGRVIEDGFFPAWGPAAYAAAANVALGVCAGPQSTPWLSFRHMLDEPWVRIFLAGTKARQSFARQYLLLGQMLRPMAVAPWTPLKVGFQDDGGQWTSREMEVPAVIQQAYRSPDGKIGWVLVNHTDQRMTCVPQPPLPSWFDEMLSSKNLRRATVGDARPVSGTDLTNVVLEPAEVVLLEQR